MNTTGTFFPLAKVIRSARIPVNTVNKKFPQWMNRDTFMMLSEIENAEAAIFAKPVDDQSSSVKTLEKQSVQTKQDKKVEKVQEADTKKEDKTEETMITSTARNTKRTRKPAAKAATGAKKSTVKGRKSKKSEE